MDLFNRRRMTARHIADEESKLELHPTNTVIKLKKDTVPRNYSVLGNNSHPSAFLRSSSLPLDILSTTRPFGGSILEIQRTEILLTMNARTIVYQ